MRRRTRKLLNFGKIFVFEQNPKFRRHFFCGGGKNKQKINKNKQKINKKAIVEDFGVKTKVFKELDNVCPKDSILASNI